MRARRYIAGALAVLALGGALAGCGDDDDDDVAADDPTDEAGEAGGDLAAYCENTIEIESVEPDIDFESLSEEEIAEASKAFASDSLLPIADEIVASAPDAVADDIAILYSAVEEVAETGDFEGAFGKPEVQAAEDAVHAHDVEACGWEQVEVTATDYAFSGIGSELESGATSFEFSNEGTEPHEVVLIRKNDDTTETFDELLELPEEEARQKTTFIGAAFADPGEGDYAVVELEAGEYIALCFVPVGTEPGAEEPADGPPHFTQGMKTEFTVS